MFNSPSPGSVGRPPARRVRPGCWCFMSAGVQYSVCVSTPPPLAFKKKNTHLKLPHPSAHRNVQHPGVMPSACINSRSRAVPRQTTVALVGGKAQRSSAMSSARADPRPLGTEGRAARRAVMAAARSLHECPSRRVRAAIVGVVAAPAPPSSFTRRSATRRPRRSRTRRRSSRRRTSRPRPKRTTGFRGRRRRSRSPGCTSSPGTAR